MEARSDLVAIDLSGVSSAAALHTELARALDFPDFYGGNWAAFWDAITGLVAMPFRLRLVGWSSFADTLPEEAERLRGCLDDMVRQYPEWAAVVEYA